MDIKITFQHMDHSDSIEQHARQKLSKVSEFFKDEENVRPLHLEMWLKANKQHAHHRAEIHLKTPHVALDAHEECPDMYLAIDSAIEKLITQLIKHREKSRDKHHKREDTEKNQFRSDKYK